MSHPHDHSARLFTMRAFRSMNSIVLARYVMTVIMLAVSACLLSQTALAQPDRTPGGTKAPAVVPTPDAIETTVDGEPATTQLDVIALASDSVAVEYVAISTVTSGGSGHPVALLLDGKGTVVGLAASPELGLKGGASGQDKKQIFTVSDCERNCLTEHPTANEKVPAQDGGGFDWANQDEHYAYLQCCARCSHESNWWGMATLASNVDIQELAVVPIKDTAGAGSWDSIQLNTVEQAGHAFSVAAAFDQKGELAGVAVNPGLWRNTGRTRADALKSIGFPWIIKKVPGSIAYASGVCGPGKLCFSYKLPRIKIGSFSFWGTMTLHFTVYQNGNSGGVISLTPVILNSASANPYCFNMPPGSITSSFDYVLTATPSWGMPALTVGTVPGGRLPGPWNNDYLIECPCDWGSVFEQAAFSWASGACEKQPLCFNYTLPVCHGHISPVVITLDLYQNGTIVNGAQLSSGTLTSGSSYCFSMPPGGLNTSLAGFDFVATATFPSLQMVNGVPVIVDIVKHVGSVSDGMVAGQNNDFLFHCGQTLEGCGCGGNALGGTDLHPPAGPCEGHWGFPGALESNLIANGHFEEGRPEWGNLVTQTQFDNWPADFAHFTSSYAWTGPLNWNLGDTDARDICKPGMIAVASHNMAYNICCCWNVWDRFGCYCTGHHLGDHDYWDYSMVLIAHGLTGQPAASQAVIWQQDPVQVVGGQTYKFCAFFHNLPACCFDIKPVVTVKFCEAGSSQAFQSIGPRTIDEAPAVTIVTPDPASTLGGLIHNPKDCGSWERIDGSITVPAGVGALRIQILLDQPTATGWGNVVAVDDISLQP